MPRQLNESNRYWSFQSHKFCMAAKPRQINLVSLIGFATFKGKALGLLLRVLDTVT